MSLALQQAVLLQPQLLQRQQMEAALQRPLQLPLLQVSLFVPEAIHYALLRALNFHVFAVLCI